MTQDLKNVKMDRMRYTKDKLSSTLALVAIVLDVLYFVKLYQQDVSTYYYNWQIGASVIYNLIFMLAAFLSSEGVKSRKTGYPVMLLVLGAMQIVRIFYLPAQAHEATVMINNEQIAVLSDGDYYYMIACLALSAVCCAVSAVASYVNTKNLTQYLRSLEKTA